MTLRERSTLLGGLLVGMLAAAACGKSEPAPSGGGAPPAATITITSSGLDRRTVTVPRGSQVLMVNNDTRAHEESSDPHPTHENCPELNSWGQLAPGQSRLSANLNTPGTCGFHDHVNPQNVALQGSIVIQ